MVSVHDAAPLPFGRRDFLKRLGLAAAASALPGGAAVAPGGTASRLVGFQSLTQSFYTEGPEHVLDTVQETAGCNAVFVFQEFKPGFLGADTTPLPDHGVPPARYPNRITPPYRRDVFREAGVPLPEIPDQTDVRDIFADLAPLCRQRGMKLFARLSYTHRHPDPEIQRRVFSSRGLDGQLNEHPCARNPEWNEFMATLAKEIFVRHPDLDGLNYLQEWGSPMTDVLNARMLEKEGAPAHLCFCEHCLAEAKSRGIDPEAARTGFRALLRLTTDAASGKPRPPEGWFFTYWRLLTRHPEVLAWEEMWWDGIHRHRAHMRERVKSIAPEANVGWHIHHSILLNFTVRAGLDYERIAGYADHIKPVVYPGCSGGRARNHWLRGIFQSFFADMPEETALDFLKSIHGLDPAGPPTLEELRGDGHLPLGPQYVRMEIERAVEAAAGRAPIYAGVGFNIANDPDTPEQVESWTRAALEAGADGLLLSREYHEMTLDNLRAVGRAVAAA